MGVEMKTATLSVQSLLGAGTLAFMVFAPAPLVQAALSPATFRSEAGTMTSDLNQWVTYTTSFQAGTITSIDGNATATIIQGVDPYLSVSASHNSSSDSFQPVATAGYTYSFEVQGPAGGNIGVLFSANGAATTIGQYSTCFIQFGIAPTGYPVPVVEGLLTHFGLNSGFPYNAYPLTLLANTEYTVWLSAYANAWEGTSSAWIDPQISIDPAYLIANNLEAGDYTLGFSPNFLPVPEPSTFIAGALVLLPVGASVLRSFRKNRAA
jgi:hypothetical protein